jgi:hypothetical protein
MAGRSVSTRSVATNDGVGPRRAMSAASVRIVASRCSRSAGDNHFASAGRSVKNHRVVTPRLGTAARAIYATPLRESSSRSQLIIWFQLAPVRSTNRRSMIRRRLAWWTPADQQSVDDPRLRSGPVSRASALRRRRSTAGTGHVQGAVPPTCVCVNAPPRTT